MKKIILCIALVFTVISMSGCSVINYMLADTGSVQTETETYTFDGVTLDLPVGFEITRQDDGGLIAHRLEQPDINETLTTIKVDESTEPMSQDEITSSVMGLYAQIADSISEMRDFTEYEIDGYTVQTFKFDCVSEGITSKYIQNLIYLDDELVMVALGSTTDKSFSEIEIANNTIRVEQ